MIVFRRLTAIITGMYSIGVVVYLLLRLIFGDGFWWLSLVNTFAYLVFAPLLVLIPAALPRLFVQLSDQVGES